MMSLSRAKNANVIPRNTVFGFVRLNEKASSLSVPEMIRYLILNYYLLDDKFASDTTRIVSEEGIRYVFGNIDVGHCDEGIAEYEWSVVIQSNASFELGLLPLHKYSNWTLHDLRRWRFGIIVFPGLLVDSQRRLRQRFTGKRPKVPRRLVPEAGDTIRMILNVQRKELSFHCKDKCLWTAGKEEGFDIGKSRLFLGLGLGALVKFKGFSIRHRQD